MVALQLSEHNRVPWTGSTKQKCVFSMQCTITTTKSKFSRPEGWNTGATGSASLGSLQKNVILTFLIAVTKYLAKVLKEGKWLTVWEDIVHYSREKIVIDVRGSWSHWWSLSPFYSARDPSLRDGVVHIQGDSSLLSWPFLVSLSKSYPVCLYNSKSQRLKIKTNNHRAYLLFIGSPVS